MINLSSGSPAYWRAALLWLDVIQSTIFNGGESDFFRREEEAFEALRLARQEHLLSLGREPDSRTGDGDLFAFDLDGTPPFRRPLPARLGFVWVDSDSKPPENPAQSQPPRKLELIGSRAPSILDFFGLGDLPKVKLWRSDYKWPE